MQKLKLFLRSADGKVFQVRPVNYINQSSMSIRLKTLEKEIGASLFIRKKGSREIVLTPEGERFYQLALQYEAIIQKMMNIKNEKAQKLRVSSFNSIGIYLLLQVYELFMQRYPEIELIIQDWETEMASRSIVQGETDIAFTAGDFTLPTLSIVPAFSEAMTFVCSMDSEYPDVVTKDMLHVQNEVYTSWCTEFREWHVKEFGKHISPKVSLEIMEQLKHFIARENRWAIVPGCVARWLCANAPIRQCQIEMTLPKRIVMCRTLPGFMENDCAVKFIECLKEVIAERKDEGIELLL